MDKTFTHAGVSKLQGAFKARFANDIARVKVLQANGHTDIDLIELPSAMTKEGAVAHLLEIDFATRDGVTNNDVKAALEAEGEKRAPKEPKVPKAPRAAAAAATGIPAAVAELTVAEIAAALATEAQPF